MRYCCKSFSYSPDFIFAIFQSPDTFASLNFRQFFIITKSSLYVMIICPIKIFAFKSRWQKMAKVRARRKKSFFKVFNVVYCLL